MLLNFFNHLFRDLSGNFITYPKLKDILPPSIETFIMNNITNGQPAIDLEFSVADFPTLKNISFERNNLCGPFPISWKTPGLNLNLKDHAKTLWCDSSVNKDACSKLYKI